jgi:hypothetical protein
MVGYRNTTASFDSRAIALNKNITVRVDQSWI